MSSKSYIRSALKYNVQDPDYTPSSELVTAVYRWLSLDEPLPGKYDESEISMALDTYQEHLDARVP